MKCPSCSAGLSAEQMLGDDCPFCGVALPHAAEAIKETAELRELLRDRDGNGVPDVFDAMGSAVFRKGTAKDLPEGFILPGESAQEAIEVSNPWVSLVFVLLVFVLIGVGLAFDPEDPLSLGLSDFDYVRDFCMVTANDDEVLDLALLASGPDPDDLRLGFVDGATGDFLYRSERMGKLEQLFCLSPSRLATLHSSGELRQHDVANPEVLRSHQLPEDLERFGVGEGCLRLLLGGGQLLDLSLGAGPAFGCPPRSELAQRTDTPKSVLGLLEGQATLEDSTASLRLTSRPTGLARLQLQYSAVNGPSWERELDLVRPNIFAAMAWSSDSIFLWGSERGAEGEGMLLVLDRSGTEQGRFEIGGDGIEIIDSLYWTGSSLIVAGASTVRSVNPESGKVDWSIGPTDWTFEPRD